MGENTRQIRFVTFIITIILALVAMGVQPVRSAIERVFRPLEYILIASPDEPTSHPELEAENDQLKRRLAALSLEETAATENSVLAEVVGYSADPYRQELIISRGSNQGVSVGAAVLAQKSLVGVVSEVEANRAIVQLVSDPLFRTVVRTEGAVEGLIMGEFGNLVMSRIPRDSAVEVGESVFTTGSSGNLPAGIFIGRVRSLENDGELLSTAFIEPLIQPSDVGAVSVVQN